MLDEANCWSRWYQVLQYITGLTAPSSTSIVPTQASWGLALPLPVYGELLVIILVPCLLPTPSVDALRYRNGFPSHVLLVSPQDCGTFLLISAIGRIVCGEDDTSTVILYAPTHLSHAIGPAALVDMRMNRRRSEGRWLPGLDILPTPRRERPASPRSSFVVPPLLTNITQPQRRQQACATKLFSFQRPDVQSRNQRQQGKSTYCQPGSIKHLPHWQLTIL